ncbi:hypothetical protein [Methylocystis sp. B8]|uniref:hypothetical protein n=1 Tax=Methylocystis sp. B8 TaxID=544938 RepID=UPI0010FF39BF|nr:hypothetical protein [Methylocystis sp. B8]TLG79221.1 hypothetical protein FEV16_04200 [Methylocystis sp. B8]
MFRKRKPSGRESVVAGATLESLMKREDAQPSHAPGMAALVAIVPGTALWRENDQRVIRLIDLERRARFSRPLTDAT